MTNVSAPLAGGYNVLLNVGYNGLSWYLDNTATDWMHVYLQEPCCGVVDALCPMILGGHVVAFHWKMSGCMMAYITATYTLK